jgi:hypothetical protein
MRLALAFVKQATEGCSANAGVAIRWAVCPSAFLKRQGLGFLHSTPPTPILEGSER